MAVFTGHSGPVSCGDWSSDGIFSEYQNCLIFISGKFVITGSEDCTVRTWDPKTGQCVHTLGGKI
jgi:WD40 repeat protein